jgi:hypothetical protein
MGLLTNLRALANHLGIIQVVKADQAAAGVAPAKIQTRSVTLDELVSAVKQDEVRTLAEAPAELTVTLAKVCEAAGVKPAGNGWTVDKLGDLLRSEKFASLSREPAQRALLELFAADKVSVEDVVKDGIARDQAVDAFEQFVRGKIEARSSARQNQIAALQAQIDDLQRQQQRLSKEGQAENEQWQKWLKRKRAYEKEMSWAIGYLLDRPVITIQDEPR